MAGVVMGPRGVMPGIVPVVRADMAMSQGVIPAAVIVVRVCDPSMRMGSVRTSAVPMSPMAVRAMGRVSMPPMSAFGERRILFGPHQTDDCRQSEQTESFHGRGPF
jgi:hypothetical protein